MWVNQKRLTNAGCSAWIPSPLLPSLWQGAIPLVCKVIPIVPRKALLYLYFLWRPGLSNCCHGYYSSVHLGKEVLRIQDCSSLLLFTWLQLQIMAKLVIELLFFFFFAICCSIRSPSGLSQITALTVETKVNVCRMANASQREQKHLSKNEHILEAVLYGKPPLLKAASRRRS